MVFKVDCINLGNTAYFTKKKEGQFIKSNFNLLCLHLLKYGIILRKEIQWTPDFSNHRMGKIGGQVCEIEGKFLLFLPRELKIALNNQGFK